MGGLGFRSGDFRFRYENDGVPFGDSDKKTSFLNRVLADGNDSYRTAAVSVGIGDDWSFGFRFFYG